MEFTHQTKRLLLQVLQPNQASMVLDFYEKNRDFLEPFEPARSSNFYTLEFQKANLSFEYSSTLKFTYLRLWLFSLDDPQVPIGTICFSNFLKGAFCSCMVGYKLDQDVRGMGYMEEALHYILPIVMKEYGMHRIQAMVLPDNSQSIRLLEKLQFEQEGLLHDYAFINNSWHDHLLYTYNPNRFSDFS